ncbi:protein mono-ADP-ribosyltransferase PARP4-like isoform X2 [Hydractinia symbiolongicarpus]|uniref:protein mono-ADP-ribosyltransferase PARP4-like isoform X2 n=1 Tax=Hydractinia symbiolongicarpus TaxID=13093 RepID=UPI00254F2221|nr:protein mono-ADP-ribosyltransferase PARP4-like isoform X2 [Hydractinia symbiolongicarpus]
MFSNCVVTLDLGITASLKEKQHLRQIVTKNGGVISYIVTKKTTHVIVSTAEYAKSSFRCERARTYNIPVITSDFLKNCLLSQKLVDLEPYLVFRKLENNELKTGKIVIEHCDDTNMRKREVDLTSLKIWSDKVDGPWKNTPFEVPKYVLLKESPKQEETSFHLFELHVQVDEQNNKKYRVWHQYGGHLYCKNPLDFKSEYRVTSTGRESEEVLGLWSDLFAENTFQTNLSKSLMIGTEYLYMWPDRTLESINELSSEVSALIDTFWTEAHGKLNEVLTNPIKSYNMADVTKAEGILLRLKDCVVNKQPVEDLSDEFYDVIQHHHNLRINIENMKIISQKSDLCQLIKDFASINESTNWQTKTSAEAKYTALGCHIEKLHGERYKDVHKDIINAINSKEEIEVLNIFELDRCSEPKLCGDKSGPFFHASEPKNFVGILSRGLLLPKIVVNDYGGSRTDAGMLGNGIYFATCPTTCIKYSKPSLITGSRFMLACQLSLGKTKDYYEFNQSLVGPPNGFDSTHGVKSTSKVPSEFKDDEYCIYDVSRLQITHIVEFKTPQDNLLVHNFNPELSEDEGIESDVELSEEDFNLDDVQNVKNPLNKVVAGLQSTGDSKIPLTAVHVRAKLQHLASEVVVLQAYTNESTEAIEAKYVFPMDSMAAVCGFEAFINGKHIIGQVKEKEQARKEYKEAISKSHGAYLMEEQEEQADVFTVSVGNLPPHADVLIKITYVAELPLEGEQISFILPGCVAPWTKKTALATQIQDEVTTVNVDDVNSHGDFSLQLSVDMPYDIRNIFSPTHSVKIKKTATKSVVHLMDEPLGDSFQLLIDLAEIHVPRMIAQRHPTDSNKQACMLTFFPEFENVSTDVLDVVFLIDLSNSMKGLEKELQKLVYLTFTNLPEETNFNIIKFGEKQQELFLAPKSKNQKTHKSVLSFLKILKPSLGATHLWKPLSILQYLASAESPKNVFLFSDGHISDEVTTLASIQNNNKNIRMFTFGMSSTANKHVLRRIADLGSGWFEYFDKSLKSKWEKKVKMQIEKSQQPVLTDVKVHWVQNDYDAPKHLQAPNEIMALFNGSRLVVYGFVPHCTMATLTASVNGKHMSTLVSTSELSTLTGLSLHRLAAKAIIEDWENGMLSEYEIEHEMIKQKMKKQIIDMSIEFSIVTKFTSFVAIEERESGESKDDTAPTIDELVAMENIDILSYMAFEDKSKIVTKFHGVISFYSQDQSNKSNEKNGSGSDENLSPYKSSSVSIPPISPELKEMVLNQQTGSAVDEVGDSVNDDMSTMKPAKVTHGYRSLEDVSQPSMKGFCFGTVAPQVASSGTVSKGFCFGNVAPQIASSGTVSKGFCFGNVAPQIASSGTVSKGFCFGNVAPQIASSGTVSKGFGFGTVAPQIASGGTLSMGFPMTSHMQGMGRFSGFGTMAPQIASSGTLSMGFPMTSHMYGMGRFSGFGTMAPQIASSGTVSKGFPMTSHMQGMGRFSGFGTMAPQIASFGTLSMGFPMTSHMHGMGRFSGFGTMAPQIASSGTVSKDDGELHSKEIKKNMREKENFFSVLSNFLHGINFNRPYVDLHDMVFTYSKDDQCYEYMKSVAKKQEKNGSWQTSNVLSEDETIRFKKICSQIGLPCADSKFITEVEDYILTIIICILLKIMCFNVDTSEGNSHLSYPWSHPFYIRQASQLSLPTPLTHELDQIFLSAMQFILQGDKKFPLMYTHCHMGYSFDEMVLEICRRSVAIP